MSASAADAGEEETKKSGELLSSSSSILPPEVKSLLHHSNVDINQFGILNLFSKYVSYSSSAPASFSLIGLSIIKYLLTLHRKIQDDMVIELCKNLVPLHKILKKL